MEKIDNAFKKIHINHVSKAIPLRTFSEVEVETALAL